MKRSLYTVGVFTRINTKRFFRDRLAIFFAILFPLIFLFVFGGIFSKSGDTSFSVAIINQSKSPIAKQVADGMRQQKVFKINKEITTLSAAHEKMARSQLDATIVFPADFGAIKDGAQAPSGKVRVVYTQNNEQAGQTLASIIDSSLRQLNGSAGAPFEAVAEQSQQNSLSRFDYTFAGLLGFAIIGMGIFGPVNVFPELKKQGVLRRLNTTPLKVWQFFLSTVFTQVLLGFVSLAIMFAVAIVVFHLDMVGNWLELVVFLGLSITSILGIGLALGGWARNERQVAPLANIVVFPMMFLSGTFFPRFLMPEWLQNVSNFLPLTPVIDGIRLIATEGKHLTDILPQVGLVGAWLLVVYLIAFRVFRWE